MERLKAIHHILLIGLTATGVLAGYFGVVWLLRHFDGDLQLKEIVGVHSAVNSGDSAIIPLTLLNGSRHPAIIEGVHTTCGCSRVAVADGAEPLYPMIVPANDELSLFVHLTTDGRSGDHVVHVDLMTVDAHQKRRVLRFKACVDVLPGATCVPDTLEIESGNIDSKTVWIGTAQETSLSIEKVATTLPEFLDVTADLTCLPLDGNTKPHSQWKPSHSITLRSITPTSEPFTNAYLRIWLVGQREPVEVPVFVKNKNLMGVRPELVWLDAPKKLWCRVTGADPDREVEIKFEGISGEIIERKRTSLGLMVLST